MAEALGVMEMYEGLGGSTLAAPPSRAGLEALRALLKDHVNARWALEAVKQGVAAAKQGNYADAHKCYERALELDPRSAEAHVARGAAHANQRAFPAAEADLRAALRLDPGHRNAAAYLEAVLRPGTTGQAPQQRPDGEDIKRALEVVLKARKHKRKSKHKSKHKKKHKKSKRRRKD
ncbi:hypothetical protein GPECTOR_1g522 [Gonium pectorale]|uniref:Uncharacterized protein n=1 Tax=Gonium pectorale TaxID=33097 RepID=A0A150H3D4_GONPE|nr:hypothetical protein GPECTOR_1g522 [Gonium pectorale]|eukprot:KXZ56581.1 hypothetical protein GPECTOR_1g522 [Gonium pectorale]